ncbi:MAG: dual specificity protein phosphatase family protein [Ktedonobacterales bacterium]
MSADTQQNQEAGPPDPIPAPPPTLDAEQATPPSEPPILSGKGFLRKGFLRWALTGTVRYLYRIWTRVAARLFPEDSRQARLASRLGIPLPDQLNMSWVTPHLAVGGRILEADIPRLAGVGITRVVDTRAEHMDDAARLASNGIELLYLPTMDTTPLSLEQLTRGAEWVDAQIAAGERVLIHCEHGVGRSVLLTAAALVVHGMSARDAMRLIQRRRWQAAPNHRQIRRLLEFERIVRAQESDAAS